MNRQQVNLYQRPPKVSGLGLNAASMALYGLLFAILMLFYVGLQQAQTAELSRQLDTLTQQKIALQAQIEELRKTPIKQVTAQLEQQRDQLQHKLEQLTQSSRLMANQTTTPSSSFAAQLSGLAEQHIKGIALQDIELKRGGGYIALAGEARPAELVPQYLQRLQQDQRFAGATFGELALERSQKRADTIRFQLGEPGESQQ